MTSTLRIWLEVLYPFLKIGFILFSQPQKLSESFCQGETLSILVATNKVCAMKSFCNLFGQFYKAYHHFLFFNTTWTFGRNYVTKKLWEKIRIFGYKGNYLGHLFQREAVSSARLARLSEKEIQLLGRWKTNFYCLYIEIHSNWIYNAFCRHSLT